MGEQWGFWRPQWIRVVLHVRSLFRPEVCIHLLYTGYGLPERVNMAELIII